MRVLIAALLAVTAFGAGIPDPAFDAAPAKGKQVAVLAGGCFWCTEIVFEHVQGISKVVSGYSGGDSATANYKAVASGKSTHAEAIEITYDPARITYGQVLKIFFSAAHDPTQLDRQGPDFGRQYRSAIFWSDAEQKKVAEEYIRQLNAAKAFPQPIVTEIVELKKFYPAEEFHQDFVKRNPGHPYVVANALPKVEKLKKDFPALFRK